MAYKSVVKAPGLPPPASPAKAMLEKGQGEGLAAIQAANTTQEMGDCVSKYNNISVY